MQIAMVKKQSDIYLLDKNTGNKIPLFRDLHVIGRASEDIAFQDPAVSREHCRTLRRGRQLFIEDLNSINKTFVNNQALEPHATRALVHGDIIRIGRQILIFSNRAHNAKSAPFKTSKLPVRPAVTQKAALKKVELKPRKLLQFLVGGLGIFAVIIASSMHQPSWKAAVAKNSVVAPSDDSQVQAIEVDRAPASQTTDQKAVPEIESSARDIASDAASTNVESPAAASTFESVTNQNQASGEKPEMLVFPTADSMDGK